MLSDACVTSQGHAQRPRTRLCGVTDKYLQFAKLISICERHSFLHNNVNIPQLPKSVSCASHVHSLSYKFSSSLL